MHRFPASRLSPPHHPAPPNRRAALSGAVAPGRSSGRTRPLHCTHPPRSPRGWPRGQRARAQPSAGVGLVDEQGSLDVVAQASEGDRARPLHPGRAPARRRVQRHQGNERLRLQARETTAPVGRREGRTEKGRTLDAHERPDRGRVDPEPLACIGLLRPVAQRAVDAAAQHLSQQRSEARVEPLLLYNQLAHAPVDLEGVGGLWLIVSGIRRVRRRDARCSPLRHGRGQCGPGGGSGLMRRWVRPRRDRLRPGRRRSRRPPPWIESRSRLVPFGRAMWTGRVRSPELSGLRLRGGDVNLDRQRGQDLGRDQLGGAGHVQPPAVHALRERRRVKPAGSHVRCTRDLEPARPHPIQVVDGARLDGRAVDGADLARQLSGRRPPGPGDPARFVVGLRHAREQAHLGPPETPLCQSLAQSGLPAQHLSDVRQILDGARRQTEPTLGVVREPRVAEPLPDPPPHERARSAGKRQAQRPARARQSRQPALDLEASVGTERLRAR
jgi:hypothetical protein